MGQMTMAVMLAVDAGEAPADFRALVEAFKAAGGQLRLFPVAA
jgi:hypothetical protein